MKILLVNKFHYIKGGSETYYFGLAELLRSHGHDVIFFSMKDERNFPCEQEEYFVDNVDFNAHMSKLAMVKMAWKMLYSKEAKKKFDKLLSKEKPDIIHLNIFQSQLTGSIVDVAKKHGIPTVYTAHDLKSVCPAYTMFNHGEVCERCLSGNYLHCSKQGCMKDSKMKSILATMEAYSYKWRKIYRKIDHVITPSLFYKKKIEEGEVFNCNITYLANFLSDESLYANAVSVGEYFLYFGRLSKEKGILTTIKAYAKLNTDRLLYIVGTGPIEQEARKLISDLMLEEKIKLLGFKIGAELRQIVSNARCVILPSEWYENGPYSVMEALAAGKPTIVSTNGGLPELVEDGVTGYISVPGDVDNLASKMKAMDELSDAEMIEMSKKSVQRAKEKFDKEKYYNYLMKIYDEVKKSCYIKK